MIFHTLKLSNKKTPAQKIRDYFKRKYWDDVLKRNNNGKYKQSERI